MKKSEQQSRLERRVYTLLALSVLASLAFTAHRIWHCKHAGWGFDAEFCESLVTGESSSQAAKNP